jgi:hypothetical protein
VNQILIAEWDASSLYQPGAILDSQTSDSQWADNLGESPPQYATQEQQVPIKEEKDESLADVEGNISFTCTLYVRSETVCTDSTEPISPFTSKPSPHLSVEHTVMEEIKSHIDKLVGIRSRELQDERDALILVLNATTEELESVTEELRSVNQENVSVAARRDILLEELGLERKWIRALECTLKDNNITLPKYPRRM